MCVLDVAFNAEDVVVTYFHGVVFFGGRFEHDDCSLFDDIIISEDYLEVLFFAIADDRAGWIDDASLAENNGSYDFVEAEV